MRTAVKEIAIHGLSLIHAKISNRMKLRKEPKPVEVEIADITPNRIDEDNSEDYEFDGEPKIYAVDGLIEETMKEYGVDTLEELGNMLTIESVMKS